MKQYVENDIKIKVEMPKDDDKKDPKMENQQTTVKKEVHLLFE